MILKNRVLTNDTCSAAMYQNDERRHYGNTDIPGKTLYLTLLFAFTTEVLCCVNEKRGLYRGCY